MKKSTLILIASLAVVIVAGIITAVVLTSNTNPPEKKQEIVWTDSAEPSDDLKDPEVLSPKVSYPQKPQSEPSEVNTSAPVTIGELTSSDACYTLTHEEDGYKVVYNGGNNALTDYAYIFIPVENYHAKYAYLKLKLNCNGVQKITIIAVYYEQYSQNRPGVTVYNNAVIEGENTVLCDLNESSVLDAHYNVALGEKVTQKKIIGFMLMVDSNPKQVIDDYSGEMLIKSIQLVDNTDPDLSMLVAPPTVTSWQSGVVSYDDIKISQEKSEKTDSMNATIEYSFASGYPYVEANIFNYKSDYTTLKMRLKGVNVKNLTIAIKYSLTTSSSSVDYNYVSSFGMEVPAEYEALEFDFSSLEELSSDFTNTIPGSYVKYLKPTALYFYIDTVAFGEVKPGGTGTLYVEDIEFVKNVDDGTPKVTSTWSFAAGNGLTKSDVASGGAATLTYDKTQGWSNVTVNVSSYNSEYGVVVIKVKFYGAKNLGVALGYGSSNTVIQNSDGNTAAQVILKHSQTEGSDDKGEYVFHTYEIDFSKATTSSGTLLKDQAINKIMFYLDAVAMNSSGKYVEVGQGSSLKTPRTMQFVSIEFKKTQEN